MKLVSLLFFLSVSVTAYVQTNVSDYFAKTFDIGSSATLMFTNDPLASVTRYRELSWNSNVKMRASKSFWVGLQIVPIFTKSIKGGVTRKENFNFYGAFLQGDIYRPKKFNVFVEGSFNRSNMLLRLNDRPEKIDGINYLGFGGGLDICLNHMSSKNLLLELGFYNYHPLNDIIDKSNYTQYIVGLNYRLGKK